MRRFLILTLSVLCVLAQPAWALTKIAPTEAEAGHPFTIIDTPDRRLVDGSVALFRLFGTEIELPLRTHKPYNTAQGRLALDMYGGLYDVFVRRPDGSEIEVGLFLVLGPTVLPPFIEPDIGLPGTAFEITDPLARMQAGDLALFYAEGGDPAGGVRAANVVVDAVGRVLTGNVPPGVATGQNFVSVRPTETAESRFGDLGFFVAQPPEPSIDPAFGPVGTPFIITDPFGRMQQGDFCIFYEPGSDPELGTQVPDAEVSPDGTMLTGTVPDSLTERVFAISVRETPSSLSRFGDLSFEVTLTAEPSISPTAGPVGTPFTITDELGRMQPGDVCLFYVPGTDPEAGTQVSDAQVSADGTSLTGTVPGVQPVEHAVTVRANPAAPSRFGDLEFQVTRAAEPSIDPASGPIGTPFTITDPFGRMQVGDVCIFYEPGNDPETGTQVPDVFVSADGATLTGTVPVTLRPRTHAVTVRPNPSGASRFGDLPFEVTLTAEPSISPTAGVPTTPFTITDPQGRMAGATVAVFFQQGQGPDQGTPVTDIVFSADGTTATGTVPATLATTQYFVTVHIGTIADPPVVTLMFSVLG